MATASGSIAYLGAARFQGFWDASTNNATGSGLPGGKWNNIADAGMKGLFSTGSQNPSGYAGDHLVSASAGDYWQVTGSTAAQANTGVAGTHNVGGIVSWQLNDWCVYSASAGSTGEWVRLGYQDTIASVIVGDLSAPDVFHLTGGANTHVVFVTGTVDSSVVFSGSKNFTFDYDNNSLGVTGTFVLDGNATLGDGDSDVTTVNSRLTASAGLYVYEKASFHNDLVGRADVSLGTNGTHVTTVNGQLTASEGILAEKKSTFSSSVLIADDTRLYFGKDQDAYIEFDETSLIISGASPAGGTKISGNLVVGADASDDFLVNSRLTASEGIRSLKKSYFATDIEVDGLAKFDGYVILGNAASDVTVATSQFTASEGILASKKSTFSASVLVTDDTKVYFGNDHDAYIEFDDTHLIISGASPAGTRVSGNIVLGNDASDIVTVSARLTASEGILASKKSYFNDSVVLGDAAADVVSVSGQLTASEGISATKKSTFSATTLISDDTKLYFGDDHDSYIEFDETNLVISGSGGSGGGVTVSGTLLVSDNTQIDGFLDVDTIRRRGDSDNFITISSTGHDQRIHNNSIINTAQASNGTGSVQINQSMKDLDFLIYPNSHVDGPLYSVWVSGSDGVVHSNYGMHVHDDKKIVFGDDNDSHIEYDTGGINDYLVISGSSAGLVLSGTSVIIDGTLEGASPLSVGDVLLADDKKIYFGTDSDAYIEYDSSFLIISGASPLGTKVSGNIILGGASDQTTISGPLVLLSDVAAGTGASPIDVALNGNLSCSANLTVGGNLLVNGTTVTQDVVNSVIQDPIIGLGYGVTGSTDASTGSAGDRGLVMGITGSNAVAMIWDNSATQFAFVTTANNPDDIEITPATYEDLRVSAIDIGGAAILSDHGVTKVQHTVTGALGGLKHDAGKLFIDLKNLPSGTTNIVPSDLMAFQDGHGSGSTRVLPVSKLINLVTASASVTALNNKAESRLLTIGSTTTELDGEANLTYDGTTFTINDDAKINDDFPFYFGSDSDALIKYRETGDNLLVISGSKGSAGGLVLSGSKLFFDGGMVSSGTVAGAGSYLGVTATGQVVLDETPGGSGAGGDITSVVAGDGLSGGAASGDATVYLNLNELSGSRTHPLAADHIAVLDSGDKGTKKLTITNLVSAITASNGGLDATSGKLSISGSALADGTVSFSNDQIIFIDSDGSPKRETIADLFAAISGTTAEFNNVTATVTSTAAVFSGSGISTIHKVNADHLAAVGNSTAAIFSGSGVSTIHKVNADHLAAVGNSTAAVFSGSGISTIHKVTSDHLNVGGNVVLSGLASGSLAGQGSYLGITTTGQIVLAAPTSSAGDGDITAVIAGDGLSGGATSGNATLYLNLNDLSGSRTHPLAGDHIAVLDSGDKGTKKLTITNLVSSMTASNGGLDATSGKLSISGSALADGTVSFDNDQIIFIDSDGSPKRETITDLFSAISGTTAEFNNVTATVTSTAAVFSGSGTSTIHKVTSDHLNVGGNVVLTGLASGSLAGQGSYLGITTSGQIVLAAPTSSAGDGDITAVIAGDGLSGGATSGNATLYLNLNDLSGSRAHPLAGDHIAVLDSGDKGTKKLTITNLVSSITASNGGLDATSGKLSISGSALADATVSFDNDQFIFIDSDGSPKRETITDLFSAISGTSAEFNNVAATVTSTAAVFSGSGISTIHKVNADHLTAVGNSTAAIFSGSGISTIHKVNADHLAAVGNSTAAIFSGSGTSTIHKITSDHLNVGGNLALTGLSSGSLAGQGSYLGITTTGQVVLAAPTSSAGGSGDITAVAAGDGLSGGAASGDATLYLNLNELSGSRTHPLAADHLAVVDSGDKGTKKLTITNLVSAITASNGGLDATSGKLSISGSALADGTVAVGSDEFIFIDSDGSPKRETLADLASAMAGYGLAESSGQLVLHFAELGGVALGSTDSIAILDNNTSTKRVTISGFGDYLCGSNGGLAHTSGVLTVSGSNLADGTVDFDNDQFMFIDSDGSPKRETITDLFSAISGTTAEFNNITATVTSNAAVFSGSGISTLHKVASQTSYASVFSGSGTSTIHKINADHVAIVGSLDLGDQHITNVGDISLDSISSDASLVTINAPSEIANSSTGGATALIIDNDDTDEIALAIEASNIDADVIDISADAVTTANVIDISADELSSGKALNIVSNSSNTTARNIALIHQDHASATAATTLRVVQDSTAPGLHVQGPVVTGVASTPSNNSSGQTVTVANMLKGTHTAMNRGSSQTDTFDTAANIVGAIPNAVVGDAFELLILNIGMNTVTFAGGTGITNLAGSAASFDIAANNGRMFKFVLQNVGGGSEAVTMCPLSDSFATTS